MTHKQLFNYALIIDETIRKIMRKDFNEEMTKLSQMQDYMNRWSVNDKDRRVVKRFMPHVESAYRTINALSQAFDRAMIIKPKEASLEERATAADSLGRLFRAHSHAAEKAYLSCMEMHYDYDEDFPMPSEGNL